MAQEKITEKDAKSEKSKIQIKLSKPLKQTNFLTDARQLFRPAVYRIIKFIVRKAYESDIDMKSFIEGKKTLKMSISIEEIKSWYPNLQYERDVADAAKWLNQTDVEYETDNGWVYTHLIGEAIYDKQTGLELYINPGALALYHVRDSEFTLLDFNASMIITKKGTQFFYDKCCKWRKTKKFEYTPDELRQALELKYENSRLKQRVLLPAQTELKELFEKGVSDVYFDLEELKEGKGQGGMVVKWIFRIRTSEDGQPSDILDMYEHKKYILEIIKNIIPQSLSNVTVQLEQLSNDEIIDLRERMKRLSEKEIPSGKIKDIKSYTHILLRDEFRINPNTKELLPSLSQKKKTKKTVIPADPVGSHTQGELFSSVSEVVVTPPEWTRFLDQIKVQIPLSEFDVWFVSGAFNFKKLTEDAIVIQIPSTFVFDKLEKDYAEIISKALSIVFNKKMNLNYRISQT